jgi:hypothetical protein
LIPVCFIGSKITTTMDPVAAAISISSSVPQGAVMPALVADTDDEGYSD